MRINTDGTPMMSEKEIEIIDSLLRENDCKNCLEYGSGNSTIYFPKQNSFIENWISMESNGHYYNYLQKKVAESVQIFVDNDPDKYVKFPFLGLDYNYDFILIDGIDRLECAKQAKAFAKNNCVILLHDSARVESVEILNYWTRSGGKVEILCDGEKFLSSGFCAHRGIARLYK